MCEDRMEVLVVVGLVGVKWPDALIAQWRNFRVGREGVRALSLIVPVIVLVAWCCVLGQ